MVLSDTIYRRGYIYCTSLHFWADHEFDSSRILPLTEYAVSLNYFMLKESNIAE